MKPPLRRDATRTTGPQEIEAEPRSQKSRAWLLVSNPGTALFGRAVTVGVFVTREFARTKRPWLGVLVYVPPVVTGMEVALYRRARTVGPEEQEARAWSRKTDVGMFVYAPVTATRRRYGAVI